MVEIRKVRPTSEYSPNIITVINAPELKIPTRGYIFSKGIKKTYGSLDEARKYFVERMDKTSRTDEIFQICFIFGNNPPDKDIFVYPFKYSANNPSEIRSKPYLIKNGVHMPWNIREKLNKFPILLDDEQINLRKYGLENHINYFPKLSRFDYVKKLNTLNNL